MSLEVIENDITEALDDLLGEYLADLNAPSGDITPMQAFEWDTIVHNMAVLFTDLISQNTIDKR